MTAGKQAVGTETSETCSKGRRMRPVFRPCAAGAGGVWYLRVDPKDKRMTP